MARQNYGNPPTPASIRQAEGANGTRQRRMASGSGAQRYADALFTQNRGRAAKEREFDPVIGWSSARNAYVSQGPRETIPENTAAFQQGLADYAAITQQPGFLPPLRPPGGGGGGGRGRGGGGAGVEVVGRTAEEIAGMQSAGLQQLLQSRMFQARGIDGELAQIGSAVSADQAASSGAYDQLDQFLGGMGNAFQGMELTQTPQVSPELLSLIAMSGGDSRAYQGSAQMANTLASQGDAASSRLAQQMAAVSSESNASRRAESQMARTFGGQQIGAQRTGMEAILRRRQADEQREMDQQRMQVVLQLIQAMGQSGQSVDISQFLK